MISSAWVCLDLKSNDPVVIIKLVICYGPNGLSVCGLEKQTHEVM